MFERRVEEEEVIGNSGIGVVYFDRGDGTAPKILGIRDELSEADEAHIAVLANDLPEGGFIGFGLLELGRTYRFNQGTPVMVRQD